MRKYYIILFVVKFSLKVISQENKSIKQDSTFLLKKNVAWISPSKVTHLNGIMLNFFPKDDIYPKNPIYPKINGVELNISPFGIILIPMALFETVLNPFPEYETTIKLDSINFSKYKKVNGIELGFANLEPSVINGLDISVVGSFESKTNGLTLGGITNKNYIANGVVISTVLNDNLKVNGLQVALFNNCDNLKGIQIGLWNKNQKRSLPFINWNFNKNPNSIKNKKIAYRKVNFQ